MPDTMAPTVTAARPEWPAGVTCVPYWVYSDPELLRAEQKAIFEGPVWTFLALEVEIPNRGDDRTAVVGEMLVIVARGEGGAIYAFENRCVHRGALIGLPPVGVGLRH